MIPSTGRHHHTRGSWNCRTRHSTKSVPATAAPLRSAGRWDLRQPSAAGHRHLPTAGLSAPAGRVERNAARRHLSGDVLPAWGCLVFRQPPAVCHPPDRASPTQTCQRGLAEAAVFPRPTSSEPPVQTRSPRPDHQTHTVRTYLDKNRDDRLLKYPKLRFEVVGKCKVG
jgi:hypothetical protein